MVLTADQRKDIVYEFMRYMSDHHSPLALTYPELSAAIATIDGWLEAVKDMLNQSSTPEGNAQLRYQDKLRIMIMIMQKRLDTQY